MSPAEQIFYFYSDFPSKHYQSTTYHSLTGNEWLDFLICTLIVIIPLIVTMYLVNKEKE